MPLYRPQSCEGFGDDTNAEMSFPVSSSRMSGMEVAVVDHLDDARAQLL